ncbi:MAG: DinB family protein [Anaerolineae bacterium]|nr:DinB family protein [Anaerolineae bacterium]
MSAITPERYLLGLRKTPVLLNAMLRGVSQEQARQCTDGPDGWTVIETLAHIRDYDELSVKRVQIVLEQDTPTLPGMDMQANTRRRDTAKLADEFGAYLESRKRLIALLSGLTAEQWERRSVHPNYGEMSLLELTVSMLWHDVNHIEQITHSLGLSDALV